METNLEEQCNVCEAPAGAPCEPTCTEAPPAPVFPDGINEDDVRFASIIRGAMLMLAQSVDGETTKAKNYVEMTFAWDNGIATQLPFRRAALTFFREGGLSPHQRAELACSEALDAKSNLDNALDRISDLIRRAMDAERKLVRMAVIAREGFSRGWDGLDAKERLDEIATLEVRS